MFIEINLVVTSYSVIPGICLIIGIWLIPGNSHGILNIVYCINYYNNLVIKSLISIVVKKIHGIWYTSFDQIYLITTYI